MQLLTIPEAAERLAVKPRAIQRLIQYGVLPYVDMTLTQPATRPRRRIRESDLVALIESRTKTVVHHLPGRERMARRKAHLKWSKRNES